MLAFLLYIHAHSTHSRNMHLIKAAQPQSGVLLVFGLKKGGIWVLFIVRVKCFFLMFSFRNVKVAAQGHYCVSEEKTPLGWFKGRSNEMSYMEFMYLYELLFGLWCDTVVAFFIVWHFYMGKIQSAKQGNLLFTCCFSGADELYSSLYTVCIIWKTMPFNSTVFWNKSHKIESILLLYYQFFKCHHNFRAQFSIFTASGEQNCFIACLYMSPMCTLYINI